MGFAWNNGGRRLLPGESPTAPGLEQQAIPLDGAGLIRVLDALPVRLLHAGGEGLCLSLVGAQSKAPVDCLPRFG